MVSILDKLRTLFMGGGAPAAVASSAEATVEYNGFVITATPFREAGQYQTSGVITKEVDGVTKEHRFIRADRYASLEDAVAFTLTKGRQIIDEQAHRPGRSLFDD
jgi:hypothetical protein